MCIYIHVRVNLYICVCARRCVSLRLSLAPLSTHSFSMNKRATICKYLFIAKNISSVFFVYRHMDKYVHRSAVIYAAILPFRHRDSSPGRSGESHILTS